MDENKEFGFIENDTISCMGIKLETFDNDANRISKVRFNCGVFDITWKPKVKNLEYINGLQLETTRPMTINNIPEKLKELGRLISRDGKVTLVVKYHTMTKDGKEYKFILSEKTLNGWTILGDTCN